MSNYGSMEDWEYYMVTEYDEDGRCPQLTMDERPQAPPEIFDAE